jgi:hypothetical protein
MTRSRCENFPKAGATALPASIQGEEYASIEKVSRLKKTDNHNHDAPRYLARRAVRLCVIHVDFSSFK